MEKRSHEKRPGPLGLEWKLDLNPKPYYEVEEHGKTSDLEVPMLHTAVSQPRLLVCYILDFTTFAALPDYTVTVVTIS